ncbi:MAG: TIM-barrel fold metal-dependent hydrolase [Hyphomicrobiales bacterium]|nr:TIM-barrel fold metal-dependent hydrolase [Hyphomicrobiales bacterium]
MIIDVHSHFVDAEYLEELRQVAGLVSVETADGKTLWRKDGYTIAWSRPDMFDLDGRIRTMDALGIDKRVLSLSTPSIYQWKGAQQVAVARRLNDALARQCRAFPDRLIGLATLPLDDVAASLEEIDRCLDELGMRGLAIGSNVDGAALTHPRFEPLWEKLDRRRIPVFEHPMFPADTSNLQEFELPLRVGLIYETTLVATRLIYSGVFERYPNFPYILAHTGGALLMILERLDNGFRLFPDCREHITRLPSEYAKRLYYDTTAFDRNALELAVKTVGASQLMFGTDDPFIGADAKHVDALGLPPDQARMIFGDTAERMFVKARS